MEEDKIMSKKGKKSSNDSRLDEIKDHMTRNKWHQHNLQTLQDKLDSGELEGSRLNDNEDFIGYFDYYIETAKDSDQEEYHDEKMYKDFQELLDSDAMDAAAIAAAEIDEELDRKKKKQEEKEKKKREKEEKRKQEDEAMRKRIEDAVEMFLNFFQVLTVLS